MVDEMHATYSKLKEDAQSLHKALLKNPFFAFVEAGEFQDDFVELLAIKQLRYNLAFVSALARMRSTFSNSPEFVVEFLDPHIATEFGGDLHVVDLKQPGQTHIAMVYDLVRSTGLQPECVGGADPTVERFLKNAITGLVGGRDKARALGALYADEILANAWFAPIHRGLAAFDRRTNRGLDLEFFRTHADEIEPAHEDHALLIFGYRNRLNLDRERFDAGVAEFVDELDRMFTALHAKASERVRI